MSSDTRMPLSSVAEIVSVKVPVSSLGGHPYVSTENLLPNLGGLGEGALPDADRVNSFNKHDTLFSNIRPYFRKVHYAPTGGGCSADVLVFRTKDPQEFWPPYLYYCLADPTFIEHTMATCKGAKMPRGDKGAMLQYLVPKPDLDAQKKVSSLLRSLDESITALQQQNTALESIAQRLFRSWFVNFDPVHAKAAGKEPEAMSAELAALFPSEFEDSELGPIPKGWSVTNLGAVADFIKGRSYKSEELQPSPIALVTLKSFQRGGGFRLDGFKPYVGKYKENQLVYPGECIVALTDVTQNADVIGRPAMVYPSDFKTVASLDVGILRPRDGGVTKEFLYCLLREQRYVSHILGHTTGTTVLHLSKDGVPSYRFALPPGQTVEKFANISGPLFKTIEANVLVANRLNQLRDHLLPRLISGKLSLEDAEQVAADAVVA